jgi:hypothetical protein
VKVKEIETPKSKIVPTESVLFIGAPGFRFRSKKRLLDAAPYPVGHSGDAAKRRRERVLLQSVTLAFRTGGDAARRAGTRFSR